HLINNAIQLLHFRGMTQYAVIAAGIHLQMLTRHAIFQGIAQASCDAGKQGLKLFAFEWLADKVARTTLHGSNHGINRGMSANHDDLSLRIHLLEFCQQVDSVLARLADVEKDHIDRLDFHLAQGGAGIISRENLESHAGPDFPGEVSGPAIWIYNK